MRMRRTRALADLSSSDFNTQFLGSFSLLVLRGVQQVTDVWKVSRKRFGFCWSR